MSGTISTQNYPHVRKAEQAGTYLSDFKATHDVFERGLKEITAEAVDTVLELIEQNSLYRGEEHKFALSKFKEAKRLYAKAKNKDLWPWFFMGIATAPVLRIRNTSIGTLLVNLSEDMELDAAVKKFEDMVAPSNYKRPTALITKGMIEKAKKNVEELGFTSALDRRFATIEDITINNVLFADRSVRPSMAEASPFDDLTSSDAINPKEFKKVKEVTIKDFIDNILPKVNSIEVLIESRNKGNLMSLIAPIDKYSKCMFKWPNNFSWSYKGEVADSMKERVKSAGGDIHGDVRFSIQWNDDGNWNQSDYDAHCKEPGGRHIYFSNKGQHASSGRLDVDITKPKKGTPAVENISYSDKSKMPAGNYRFFVNNYRRDNGDCGFRAEVEIDGEIHSYSYNKPLKSGENITVATLQVANNGDIDIAHHLDSSFAAQEVWGLQTQQFAKVRALMYSPNHWDEHAVGNKHVFFILEGCINPDDSRGFYNEFLKEDLNKHRKVFEVLGSKMKAKHSDNQLSGLGFSTTNRNHVFCKVAGNFTRTLKVTF